MQSLHSARRAENLSFLLDISDDLRVRRVYKMMRGFGNHQYSAFERQLTRADLARCRHILSEIIDHRADWLAVRGLTTWRPFRREIGIVTTGRGGGWKDGWFQRPLWMQLPHGM
jgi:CRISPR/Cas system-associated endoribonuclease Cas2